MSRSVPLSRTRLATIPFAGLAAATVLAVAAVADSTPLTAARRAAVADSVAALLDARYPDETLGRRLADSLRAWARADAWRADTGAVSFAQSLQRDLRRVVPDEHLWARWEPGVEYVRGPQMRRVVPGGEPGAVPRGVGDPPVNRGASGVSSSRETPVGSGGPVRRTMRIDSRDSLEIARTNFGFTKAEMLEGGIGYLKLDRFVPRDLAEPTAVASMAGIAEARAVVLDLRENPGGSPDLVALLLSWFLDDAPKLIHASYWRAMATSDSLWSLPRVPGPRLTGRPLYVLISPRTASAAEMFAYAARRLGVATLVGETTAGAGQGGMTYSVGEGITLFAPERKVLTGPGWERVGVAPDVSVPAEQALERALAAARAAR